MSEPALRLSPIGHELLDDPAAPAATVAESLGNIARSNRWFGGTRAFRAGLARVLAGVPAGGTITLLDLGTGTGDLPRDAVRWAARRGLTLACRGLERHPVAARLATAGGVPCVVGCAGAPPFRAGSVDVVTAAMLAHHLDDDSIVRLVQASTRVARLGVVLADLRRSALAAAGFRLGARLLGFDAVTIADGLTSLRRGFTPASLQRLLARAGVHATITTHAGARLVATWRAA